jgi:TIR domain
MYRVFVSHSRRDNAAAQAAVRWLTESEPSLKGEVFLDVDPHTGFAPGVRWKSELVRAVDCCEAVICLISPHWEKSGACVAQFRLAESLNKRVFCARIDPQAHGEKVREWQVGGQERPVLEPSAPPSCGGGWLAEPVKSRVASWKPAATPTW